MIKTPLSEKLGLRYPFVCAPMFLISNKEMLVAASKAGILGAMPALNARTIEEFRTDLEWLKANAEGPYAINLTIKLTAPERLEQDLEACLEYEVPVLITSYGNPTEITRRAHAKGITVFHDVVGLTHAKKAESAGADAIIGVCSGAGGHAGTTSPYVLLPYLKENLNVPIIAAGCISTGQQVAASLALGAELVYMGTRFIASQECGAQDAYKQMVVDAKPEDIIYTDQVSGVHANFFKETVPKAGEETTAKRWKEIWSAGQGSALVKEIKPIEEIVADIAQEYEDTVAGLPRASVEPMR